MKCRAIKSQLVYLIISIISLNGCKKDDSLSPENHFGEIFQVSLTMDNVPLSKIYPPDSVNIIQSYQRSQPNGNAYFGSGPVYVFSDGTLVEIQLGSAYGPVLSNPDSAYASFVALCAPGDKLYDFVWRGNQELTNRVEITYSDKNGDLWSTSKIDATNPREPTPISSPGQQDGSSFVVTEEKQISFDNKKNNGVLIKGRFSCTLYKYSSFEQKQVKNGSFVAVF